MTDSIWYSSSCSYGSNSSSSSGAYNTYAASAVQNFKNYYLKQLQNNSWYSVDEPIEWPERRPSLHLSKDRTYSLPDGAQIEIDKDGNYQIQNKDAQVIYKANNFRDFSPHLNANEMLHDFVKYIVSIGVPENLALKTPIELFISWLIIEAAEKYGDEPEVGPITEQPLLQSMVNPKCLQCKRFIPRINVRRQFHFCNGICSTKYAQLQLAS